MIQTGMVDRSYAEFPKTSFYPDSLSTDAEILSRPKTASIKGAKIPEENLQRDMVAASQEYLEALGFDPKGVDAKLGRNTALQMDEFINSRKPEGLRDLNDANRIQEARAQLPAIHKALRTEVLRVLSGEHAKADGRLDAKSQRTLRIALKEEGLLKSGANEAAFQAAMEEYRKRQAPKPAATPAIPDAMQPVEPPAPLFRERQLPSLEELLSSRPRFLHIHHVPDPQSSGVTLTQNDIASPPLTPAVDRSEIAARSSGVIDV